MRNSNHTNLLTVAFGVCQGQAVVVFGEESRTLTQVRSLYSARRRAVARSLAALLQRGKRALMAGAATIARGAALDIANDMAIIDPAQPNPGRSWHPARLRPVTGC